MKAGMNEEEKRLRNKETTACRYHANPYYASPTPNSLLVLAEVINCRCSWPASRSLRHFHRNFNQGRSSLKNLEPELIGTTTLL